MFVDHVFRIKLDSVAFQVESGECFVYAYWPSLTFSSVFGVFLIFIQFIIPLIILVFCYGRIVWILSKRVTTNFGNSRRDVTESKAAGEDKFQLARNNTIKTFLLVGICFIVCWSNNQVYYLMYNLGYKVDWTSVYYQFTVLMVFLNCTINPFIYLIKYRDYQKALKNCLPCGKHEDTETSGPEASKSNVSNAGVANGGYI